MFHTFHGGKYMKTFRLEYINQKNEDGVMFITAKNRKRAKSVENWVEKHKNTVLKSPIIKQEINGEFVSLENNDKG